MSPDAPFLFDRSDEAVDGWVMVTGGRLSQAVRVKVVLVDGRLEVQAVQLDNGQPVTSSTLREVKVGAILEQYLPDLQAQMAITGVDSTPWSLAVRDELAGLLDDMGGPEADWTGRSRGASPPTDQELRTFADQFKSCFARKPRSAVSEVARQLGMHRSTAYRWVQLCRTRGFLEPTKEISE